MLARSMLRSRRLLAASALLAAALLAFALLEGDLLEEFVDIRHLFFALLGSFGVAGSLFLLYLEESGVPLPLPGDAILLYLGSHSRPLLLTLVLAVAAVAAGSTNLYFISRRFGPRLLASKRLTAFLHLPPERLLKAQSWFERYGAFALIFGRHVPGLRIPLTVVSGTFGLPYRAFLPSVIVSATLWAALWLYLGARYAPFVEAFLTAHSWLYFLIGALTLAFLSFSVVRALRAR
jgi:membrane protein DedA with SNARE-associated domain